LNLTPQPDSIQETSIQVNTFSAKYSRAAGLQTMFTTRSARTKYHGSASDYFNYQGMYARQYFRAPTCRSFQQHGFAIGGPSFRTITISLLLRGGTFALSRSTNGSVTFSPIPNSRLLRKPTIEHGGHTPINHLPSPPM